MPAWNAYVLRRKIIIGSAVVGYDAIGIYPIEILSPSADVKSGLSFLWGQGLVSVILILDDFHRPSMDVLTNSFSVCRKFKNHYIFDPHQRPVTYDKHHRYELRQAHKAVRTQVISLAEHMNDWLSLYASLSSRHNLSGSHIFPIEHLNALSQMDNVVAFGAFIDNQLVSCHIWVEYEGYAHSHLAASNDQGYASRAAYALNDFALHYFKDHTIVNFGGGAGINDENNGLSKFKKGFSNKEVDALICGKILDQKRYDELIVLNGVSAKTNFFPAYRSPKMET